MKYAEINTRYTEIVTEYMSKGYTINTASMRGSQGEVAKIDLTDGNEIIRIYVASFSDWRADAEGYEIVVGKCKDDTKPNSDDNWNTIWNGHLEILHTERFYKISRHREDYFGTKEEAEAAGAKRIERFNRRRNAPEKYTPSAEAMEIAKRIVRRKMGYKRIDHSAVKLCKGANGYFVQYNGKTCSIH